MENQCTLEELIQEIKNLVVLKGYGHLKSITFWNNKSETTYTVQ